jgi:hypothetical protein
MSSHHGRGLYSHERDRQPGHVRRWFIAAPDDRCDDLFGFYNNGTTEFRVSDGRPSFHMDDPGRTLFREATARIGCHVVGRQLSRRARGARRDPIALQRRQVRAGPRVG